MRGTKQKEGRKIKSLDPMNKVAVYIMPTRSGASNLFADRIYTEKIEKYIQHKRKEGLKGFGILHIILAAYVRTVSQRPGINRFIRGQRVYARNNIEVIMTVKKELKLDAPESVIKAEFKPDYTAEQVFHTFNELVKEGKGDGNDDFEGTAKLFNFIPGLFLKFAVFLLKGLDYFGLIPKSLIKVSPFHGSIVITSMGSLGIPAIYHHLYEFGTVPLFMAYGMKKKENYIKSDGTVGERKYFDFNVTTDERICDGHYFASALKYMMSILENPEVLDEPPEKVVEDIK